MDNTAYYIFALVLLIVVFLLIRKIASCLIKMVIMAILVAALAYMRRQYRFATLTNQIQ